MTQAPPTSPDGSAAHSTDSSSTLDDFLDATPRQGQRQLISLVVLAIAFVAIAALFVRFVAGSDSPYYVVPIEAGTFEPRLSEQGIVHGEDELPIRARLDGQLASLPVKSGQSVHYGEVLARIEARGSDQALAAQKATLASNQADLEQAQVTLQDARTRLARFETVWSKSDHRVPSLNEMEQARADAARASDALNAAKARVDAARLQVKAEEERARARVIRAPFDGVVVLDGIQQGQSVFVDMPLFTLSRAGTPLAISVPLASRKAMTLKPGAKAKVRFDAVPDAEAHAVLKRIETTNDTRVAHFELLAPATGIQPGMRGQLEVTLDERNDVLLVPDAALDFRPSKSAPSPGTRRPRIYLLGKDGNPRRVYVTLGGSDGGHTEVFSSQLHAGDEVIIGWRDASDTVN